MASYSIAGVLASSPIGSRMEVPARGPRNSIGLALKRPGMHGWIEIFPSIGAIPARTPRNFVVLALASTPGKDNLAADFMCFVNSSGHSWPLENRKPTPLMPPSTVVKTQMDALMRNDWPDENSGMRTAFDFSLRPLPYQYDEIPDDNKPRARAWDASGRVLTCEQFIESFKYSSYFPMVDCLDWKVISRLVFQSERRAVQAVEVRYKAASGETRTTDFTFSLQQVLTSPYKDCWMVAGARLGNHTN